SEILHNTGLEDAYHEDYAAYPNRFKKAAQDISDAVKLNNHEAARKAAGEISKACTECHEGYRG
ncbi:MAG: cytochrome c, partial [Planctomycetota bacterium]|nr:cytochrome c [Planctomycetota bacterium]